MADYTHKRIDDMYATYLGGMKHARAELGVQSFGMQVIDLPPNLDGYPEHDHSEAGQEEVYVVLSGAVDLTVDGETVRLEEGSMARVGPDARRKLETTDQPVRLLALGGTPGKAYEPSANTEVGAPDPLARN
jgi:mannose-6-phosphate isomerase-like protein (cupin superfamily)